MPNEEMQKAMEFIGDRETTRATDERLNVLINVVEQQIKKGRNGKP